MFTVKTYISVISVFVLVGLSGLTKGSLLINYPSDGFGSWHRNNFLNFLNWDSFDDDQFEVDFFHNHDLYSPSIHRELGVRHVTVARPLVKRNDNELFQLFIDVIRFDPNELSVKLVGRELLVKGVHTCNANQQRPCFSRTFCWRRTLPDDVDLRSVKATLIKPSALEIEAKKIKDYESDIWIDVRDMSTDQSQPQANHNTEKQNLHEQQSVKHDTSKEDKDATVEIIADENLNSFP